VFFQCRFVGHDAIKAAVQPVLACHGGIGVEQDVHRGLAKPFFVDVEFAAGLKEPVDRQQFQHLGPGNFARLLAQLLLPERAQAELLPRVATHPAVTESARLFDRESGEFDFDDIVLPGRRGAFLIGEDPPLMARTILMEHVQRLLPRVLLPRVEFTQMQHLPLHRASTMHPQAFADRIVDVFFAVFAPRTPLEEHRGRSIAHPSRHRLRARSAHTRFPIFSEEGTSKKPRKWPFRAKLGLPVSAHGDRAPHPRSDL
jgi:hypothetical protein